MSYQDNTYTYIQWVLTSTEESGILIFNFT